MIEEEQPEPSGCAGAAVITAAVAAPLLALYAITPEGFVLGLWALGWGAVIWVAKKTPKSVADTAGLAPPAPSERGVGKKPQVSMIRDSAHPNRWIVARPSRWLGAKIEKES